MIVALLSTNHPEAVQRAGHSRRGDEVADHGNQHGTAGEQREHDDHYRGIAQFRLLAPPMINPAEIASSRFLGLYCRQ